MSAVIDRSLVGRPVGSRQGSRGAHQIINRSDDPARYLMVSTMVEPDIAEYPDSGNVGMFAGRAPGGAGSAFRSSWTASAEVDYFEGA